MVTVTFAGSPEEVHDESRRFYGPLLGGPVKIAETTRKVEQIDKVKEKPVEKAAVKETVVEKPAEKVVEKEAPKETAPTADLYDQIRALIPELMRAGKKREEVAKFLKDGFGATKGSEIKTEDQARFITEAKAWAKIK